MNISMEFILNADRKGCRQEAVRAAKAYLKQNPDQASRALLITRMLGKRRKDLFLQFSDVVIEEFCRDRDFTELMHRELSRIKEYERSRQWQAKHTRAQVREVMAAYESGNITGAVMMAVDLLKKGNCETWNAFNDECVHKCATDLLIRTADLLIELHKYGGESFLSMALALDAIGEYHRACRWMDAHLYDAYAFNLADTDTFLTLAVQHYDVAKADQIIDRLRSHLESDDVDVDEDASDELARIFMRYVRFSRLNKPVETVRALFEEALQYEKGSDRGASEHGVVAEYSRWLESIGETDAAAKIRADAEALRAPDSGAASSASDAAVAKAN